MALEYDKTSKLFQANYQAPFGGLDSTAYASAINPANFASMSGIYIEDNYIKPIAFQELIEVNLTGASENFMGYIPITSFTNTINPVVGYVISNQNVYPVIANIGVLTLGAGIAYVPAINGGPIYFHYIVINDIQTGSPSIYWTTFGWNEIWSYDSATNITALTTNYCGGGILGLLDNQLLNLGGYSQADGATPNRISWSAPGEYGQFQPYDVGSGTGNYAAGFNDLPSISDIITGFASIGTVGYIFRYQGITQMNPTGNGIEPFTFNHLWASQLGIGAVLPNSVAQYGSSVLFIANDSIFSLSLAGLSNIGQAADSYIFNAINNAPPFSGTEALNFTLVTPAIIVPYILDSPDVFYILTVEEVINTVSYWHVIGIRINDSKVYDFGAFPALVSGLTPSIIQLAFISAYTVETGQGQPSFRIKVIFITSLQRFAGAFEGFQVRNLVFNNATTGTLAFRKEQMKFGYWPTVTKTGFLAALIDTTADGAISISVDGGLTFNVAFPDIVITPGGTNENGSPAGTTDPGNGVIGTIFSDGEQSLERPQLVIKLTNVQIAEAWYQGTLADYPVI